MKSLERSWYRPRGWSLLLTPLSWLFMYLVRRRRRYLEKRRRPLHLPVVIIGNITVGGTGKTPLIISLVNELRQRGYRPGVVSRGYGGRAPLYPMQVQADTDPRQCGDEPLLIATTCRCPVIVDPDRFRAASLLQEIGECDVILSDDGLQHYRLPRDIEVVVVDGERLLGNGRCLPAGPLREPISRLAEAEFAVINGSGHALNHPRQYRMELLPLGFRNLRTGETRAPNNPPGDGSVNAVAGIGNPTRFARTLASLGLGVKLHPLPDHHEFSPSDLRFGDGRPVIVTAKDAVKIGAFAADNIWVLDVAARLDNNGIQSILEAIEGTIVRP